MKKVIEDVYFVLAYAAGVLLAFVSVLPRLTETVFFVSLGVGIMSIAFALGLSISLKPLRRPWTIVKIITCFFLLILGGGIVSPSISADDLSPIWALLAGFVITETKFNIKQIPNYAAVIAAFVLSFFEPLRWLTFAILSIDAFVYVFFLKDMKDRFNSFYVASFSCVVAVYFIPYFESHAFGLFISVLSLSYGFTRSSLETVLEIRRQNAVLTKEERALAAVEERALREEIRPHFLLNVLNNVLVAYHEDPAQGKLLLQQLIDLENHSSDFLDESYIPLRMELETIQKVFEIFCTERHQHIQLELDVQDDTIPIPPLLLEPLVENALIHSGVSSRPDGRILVRQRKEFGYVTLTVGDNGIGADMNRFAQGIGVSNVHRRVELLAEGRMDVQSAPNEGTTIKIIFRRN